MIRPVRLAFVVSAVSLAPWTSNRVSRVDAQAPSSSARLVVLDTAGDGMLAWRFGSSIRERAEEWLTARGLTVISGPVRGANPERAPTRSGATGWGLATSLWGRRRRSDREVVAQAALTGVARGVEAPVSDDEIEPARARKLAAARERAGTGGLASSRVTASPSGASTVLDGTPSGALPDEVSVPRDKDTLAVTLAVSADGYETSRSTVGVGAEPVVVDVAFEVLLLSPVVVASVSGTSAERATRLAVGGADVGLFGVGSSLGVAGAAWGGAGIDDRVAAHGPGADPGSARREESTAAFLVGLGVAALVPAAVLVATGATASSRALAPFEASKIGV